MLQHKRTNSVQMSDGELVLIVPSKDMQEDAIGYKEEHFAYGDMQVHGTGGLAYYDDYDTWLEHIEDIRNIKEDVGVRTSTFFTKRLSDSIIAGELNMV